MNRLQSALIALALLVTPACDGLTKGGGGGVVIPTPTQFVMKLTPDATTAKHRFEIRVSQDYILEVTEANANVTDIVLPLPEDLSCDAYGDLVTRYVGEAVRIGRCGQGSDTRSLLHFEDNYDVELTTGASEPAANNLILPAGAYNSIQLWFETNGAAPGTAVEMAGRLRDANGTSTESTGLRFALSSGQLPTMTLFAQSASAVSDAGDNQIVVSVAGDAWFRPLQDQLGQCIDSAAPVTDTVVLNNEDSSPLPAVCTSLTDAMSAVITDAASVELTADVGSDATPGDTPPDP